ncbi:MAG: polysaccharide pyruvyl transferase family protein [Maricaulis sp.]|uniref:polysaccharide pyruvyl transferase family protein n=1 Tax=Maricaulis sp. TaxID=1486257 RepID=UPI001B1179F7|nr:polysaccharide pyruvyl transferase family protein [Maricaulis sp.]MBO6728434.1 polysaccharide pyruvyl transferase family protein [Maricaulis sp.]MBO6848425.1 polysaccharide pyruvyl transferase family protein [Maricaulis sp.]MBO6878203.1 polysaccharide pyruvyl transferase family protein [Maricaulis sp.]
MASKVYLDLPYTTDIPAAFKFDSTGLMDGSGHNLGNFAFRHALRFIVNGLDGYQTMRWRELHERSQEIEIDNIVLSCANWLGLSDQDEAANKNRTRAISSVEGQATCFGLGVQAKLTDELPTLRPNTLEFARILSSRAVTISVRDEMTRNVLYAAGIKNAVVTGCPSNFINPDPTLGKTISDMARTLADQKPSWRDLRSCISEASGGHPFSSRVLRSHIEMLDTDPGFYLIQSPALLPFLLGESEDIPAFYANADPFKEETGKLAKIMRRSLLHFSSVDGWMDFARSCHISFGMRIHGTMVPLQAGVPSALIAHDTRTVGLAERMGIPWVTPEDFVRKHSESPVGLLNHIADVMESYDKRRGEVGETMLTHVKSNGLPPHPALEALITGKRAAPQAAPPGGAGFTSPL